VVFAFLSWPFPVARIPQSPLFLLLFFLNAYTFAFFFLVFVDEVASGYDFETAEENHGDYCSAKMFVEGGAREGEG
jgi:hypothetical protein